MDHPIDSAPPELQSDCEARAEALAAYGRVESRRVGFAAAPSEAYAAFRALVDDATDEQLEELLTHESPVVRAYVASFLVGRHGPEHPALQPLREDETEVFTLVGCTGGKTTVKEMASGTWRFE